MRHSQTREPQEPYHTRTTGKQASSSGDEALPVSHRQPPSQQANTTRLSQPKSSRSFGRPDFTRDVESAKSGHIALLGTLTRARRHVQMRILPCYCREIPALLSRSLYIRCCCYFAVPVTALLLCLSYILFLERNRRHSVSV